MTFCTDIDGPQRMKLPTFLSLPRAGWHDFTKISWQLLYALVHKLVNKKRVTSTHEFSATGVLKKNKKKQKKLFNPAWILIRSDCLKNEYLYITHGNSLKSSKRTDVANDPNCPGWQSKVQSMMIMFSSQSKSTMNYTYNVTVNNVNVAEIVILLWRIAQWASLRSTYITTTHTAITSGQKKYLKRWRIPTSLAIITAAKGELVSCWVCGLYDYVLSLSILLILFLFETATPPSWKMTF